MFDSFSDLERDIDARLYHTSQPFEQLFGLYNSLDGIHRTTFVMLVLMRLVTMTKRYSK